jgi:hypothetical protein
MPRSELFRDDSPLLPPNQLETRGNTFKNRVVFRLMGADGFKAQPIDRAARNTECQKHPQYAVTAHEACLCTAEPADAGLLYLLPAGSAGRMRQFSSYAFLWTLPLKTIGLSEDDYLTAGSQ